MMYGYHGFVVVFQPAKSTRSLGSHQGVRSPVVTLKHHANDGRIEERESSTTFFFVLYFVGMPLQPHMEPRVFTPSPSLRQLCGHRTWLPLVHLSAKDGRLAEPIWMLVELSGGIGGRFRRRNKPENGAGWAEDVGVWERFGAEQAKDGEEQKLRNGGPSLLESGVPRQSNRLD